MIMKGVPIYHKIIVAFNKANRSQKNQGNCVVFSPKANTVFDYSIYNNYVMKRSSKYAEKIP